MADEEPRGPAVEAAAQLVAIIGVSNRLGAIEDRLKRLQADLRRPRGPVSLWAVAAASALGASAAVLWWSLPRP